MVFKYCWINLLVLTNVQSSNRTGCLDFLNLDNLVCYEYLVSGTKYNVSDEQLSASSEYNTLHAAKWGRLNTVYVKGEHIGGWAVANVTPSHYIEVRFNELNIIQAIATQGRNITGDSEPLECYVTKYAVYYKPDHKTSWTPVRVGPGLGPKVFQGNNDSNSIHTNQLPCAVQARAVRIRVIDSYSYPSMRFDVLGCPVSQDCTFEDGFCHWKNEDNSWNRTVHEQANDNKTAEVLVGVAVGVGVLCLSVLIIIGIYVGRRRLFRSSAATASIKTDLGMALSSEMSTYTVQEYASVRVGKSESVSPDPIYDNNQRVQNRLIKEEHGQAVVSKPKMKIAHDTQEEQIYDHLDTGVKVPRLDDETYAHVKKK